MSDQDQVRPYHAKDAAPGQEAADVVAEVLKHAAEREEAARAKVLPKGPPKWMLPVSLNLGVLALFFLIAQPDFLVISQIEDPRSADELLATHRSAMWMEGVQRIERFRANNGRLPSSLEEAGSSLQAAGIDVDYSVQGDAYILIATVAGETITYDSATTLAEEFVPDLAARLRG